MITDESFKSNYELEAESITRGNINLILRHGQTTVIVGLTKIPRKREYQTVVFTFGSLASLSIPEFRMTSTETMVRKSLIDYLRNLHGLLEQTERIEA